MISLKCIIIFISEKMPSNNSLLVFAFLLKKGREEQENSNTSMLSCNIEEPSKLSSDFNDRL